MKFKCTCGNVINGTVTCKDLCKLYTEYNYVQWIKYLCEVISYKEYGAKYLHTFYCEECKRFYIYVGNDLYVFKTCLIETILPDDYEAYHLVDEFESGEKINETFLKTQTDAGKKIIFSHNLWNPKYLGDTSFAKEIQYLTEKANYIISETVNADGYYYAIPK